ncbi:hypothetical protein ACUN8C_12505 [Kushneria sp. Sum13]|uniref:hypothetical protein n=1 Tax=Kushneria sp. Sum13 TaxID=3459196 RepID=UPI004045E747
MRDYTVDTRPPPPALSITLDTIAGDNIVNADESKITSPENIPVHSGRWFGQRVRFVSVRTSLRRW